MWNGIATRHADTIDTKFFVDGSAVVLGLAHTAFVKFRERFGRDLSDREASFIAGEFLRERLEEEDERPLYDVSEADVLRLIEQIGIKKLERTQPRVAVLQRRRTKISPQRARSTQRRAEFSRRFRRGKIRGRNGAARRGE